MSEADVNRELWDAWTELHVGSAFYDVPGFLAGRSSLNGLELEEVGEVRGRSLLHLQCHIGLDTLSWVRLGAQATGVDFSERAVAAARELAERAGLEARFVCSTVYDLGTALDERFDIVFTSYGVLPWLPDLERWAEAVFASLAPGGFLYLAEFHPTFDMFGDDGGLAYPYFNRGPIHTEVQGSYATERTGPIRTEYTWPHPLADVVNALIRAGLNLEFLHEHDYSPYGISPLLEQVAPGRWMVPGRHGDLPLVYSLKATRAA